MNDVGMISEEIDISCPHCGLQCVELPEHRSLVGLLPNECGTMQPTSFGNSLPQKGNLGPQNLFQ